MWNSDDDIRGQELVVLDLEWVGNSLQPHTTHVTQISALHVRSQTHFDMSVQTMISEEALAKHYEKVGMTAPNEATHTLSHTLFAFSNWLKSVCNTPEASVIFVAHNGIRHDALVLRNAFAQCGIGLQQFPNRLLMVDSLQHIRYQLRHSAVKNFGLDSLASHFGVDNNAEQRHSSLHDVYLLHSILTCVQKQKECAYVTGVLHNVSEISCMVVRGIGPVVCAALNNISLRTMCEQIIKAHGNLQKDSCELFLNEQQLREKVPLAHAARIAEFIGVAAKKYLHYIDL